MPGLDPQIAMHRVNIKPGIKLVKQQQRQFRPDIMETIEAEVHKLIECGFIRKENTEIGLLTLSPFLKRMKKSRSILIITILMYPALKMSSHYPSLTS